MTECKGPQADKTGHQFRAKNPMSAKFDAREIPYFSIIWHMSSPIRPADREHFSIVRESLSLEGLHVAMAGRDRGQLLNYAATLATTLAEQDGWHVEKYDPTRLEALIVDLMLQRFDAALQTLSDHARFPLAARHPGCVLFIPDAQTMPAATFRQLLRLVAGVRDRRLRVVALFVGDRVNEETVAAMGTQVVRWDLDDDISAQRNHPVFPDPAAQDIGTAASRRRTPPRTQGQLLAVAAAATLLAILPVIWPAVSGLSPTLMTEGRASIHNDSTTELAGTLHAEKLPARLPVAVMREKDNSLSTDSPMEPRRSSTEDLRSTEAVAP